MRTTTVLAFAIALAPWASTSILAADAPLALHPDNPRYFLFRGKPTVVITSGEHYGAVLNLDFDFVTYLDTLAKAHLKLDELTAVVTAAPAADEGTATSA